MKEQTFHIVTTGLDVMHLRDLHALEVRHVAEHGHRALLEGLVQGVAPCVQSETQSVIRIAESIAPSQVITRFRTIARALFFRLTGEVTFEISRSTLPNVILTARPRCGPDL